MDWEDVDGTVRSVIGDALAVPDAMARAVSACGSALPAEAAKQILTLDYSADARRLSEWLVELFDSEPPPRTVVALYFGMVMLTGDEGTPSMDLYLAGSTRFDPDDESCEWAVDPVYFPEARYAGSPVMETLARVGAQDALDEVLTATYAVSAVREACTRTKGALLRAGAKRVPSRAIAVGHDAGAAWLLGSLTADGWVAHAPE